jgi:two-component system phosphate regulon sensor histidine kinase PhoR
LAIVKHILEGHNSKPEVQSEVGKGSEFSFKLSRSKGDDED